MSGLARFAEQLSAFLALRIGEIVLSLSKLRGYGIGLRLLLIGQLKLAHHSHPLNEWNFDLSLGALTLGIHLAVAFMLRLGLDLGSGEDASIAWF